MAPPTNPLVTPDDITRAEERIRAAILPTPLLALADDLWVKAESLQRTGSFKLRGAHNALATLGSDSIGRVVTHSSGNHALAVAHAARSFGIEATIVMPSNGSGHKRAAVERSGARVMEVGPASEERSAVAHELARELGVPLIHSSDALDVIAGQGTLGLEVVRDFNARPSSPEVVRVFVPIGGGGLASGVAVAIKALAPEWTVTGVEPQLSADAQESLRTGEIVRWPVERVCQTIADGVRHTQLGPITFAHLTASLDDIVTVTDDQIKRAMLLLHDELGLRVEPSAALSVAAALAARRAGTTAICIATGGNVDPDAHAAWLEEATASERGQAGMAR